MATSSRPYLIRGLYEWIVDNGWVPHLLVDTRVKNVQVPEEYVSDDGRIILNISPDATRGLLIGNDRIIFTTRFAGVSYQVCLPPSAVKAIYAKENGEGMVFPEEEDASSVDGGSDEPPPTPPSGTSRRKPQLKVVK